MIKKVLNIFILVVALQFSSSGKSTSRKIPSVLISLAGDWNGCLSGLATNCLLIETRRYGRYTNQLSATVKASAFSKKDLGFVCHFGNQECS